MMKTGVLGAHNKVTTTWDFLARTGSVGSTVYGGDKKYKAHIRVLKNAVALVGVRVKLPENMVLHSIATEFSPSTGPVLRLKSRQAKLSR
jgi:hypothetical protein